MQLSSTHVLTNFSFFDLADQLIIPSGRRWQRPGWRHLSAPSQVPRPSCVPNELGNLTSLHPARFPDPLVYQVSWGTWLCPATHTATFSIKVCVNIPGWPWTKKTIFLQQWLPTWDCHIQALSKSCLCGRKWFDRFVFQVMCCTRSRLSTKYIMKWPTGGKRESSIVN